MVAPVRDTCVVLCWLCKNASFRDHHFIPKARVPDIYFFLIEKKEFVAKKAKRKKK